MITKLVLNALYFTQLDRLTRSVMGGIGNIWMLHRVSNAHTDRFSPNEHLRISPEFLDAAIMRCKSEGYRFVSLDEIVKIIENGGLKKGEQPVLCITLDDGYVDNLQNAVPIFRRHQVPYTIFVASGLIDGTHSIWWEDLEHIVVANKKISVSFPQGAKTYPTQTYKEMDVAFYGLLKILAEDYSEDEQREIMAQLCKHHNHDCIAHSKSQLMSWDQLRKLGNDPLCTLGAHTVGHYAVAKLEYERAKNELEQSRQRLEEMTGHSGQHFAFPYGYASAAGERDFNLVRELGFRSGVTTRYGVLRGGGKDNSYGLPRVSLNGHYQSYRYLRPLMCGTPSLLKYLGDRDKFA